MTYWLSSAMIDAAAEGLGLALAQHSMVASALAAGTLVRLGERSIPMPQPYFLGWNGTALDRPLGAAFQSWLINEARRFDWQAAGANPAGANPAAVKPVAANPVGASPTGASPVGASPARTL